jgi:medium-chain acyl-[acyl-carrier-protein] hydrolase
VAEQLTGIDCRWTPYRVHRPAARLRLLCFSYAGVGASIFRPWIAHAPDAIDVWPIQLPSKGARFREAPHSRIEPLIDELCEALASCLCGPYALFGCSMGAVVAFELARAARRRGMASPVRLFAAARRPPDRPDAHQPMHLLPDDEFIRQLSAFDGTPPELLASAEVMACYLPSIRADFALCERYVYRDEPRLDCPLTALGGDADPYVSVGELSAWCTATNASFTMRVFEGNHFFVQSCWPAVLRAVADDCRADLASRERNGDGSNDTDNGSRHHVDRTCGGANSVRGDDSWRPARRAGWRAAGGDGRGDQC